MAVVYSTDGWENGQGGPAVVPPNPVHLQKATACLAQRYARHAMRERSKSDILIVDLFIKLLIMLALWSVPLP